MNSKTAQVKLTLFTKWSIAVFSILCTYFCGVLMLAYNLRQTGKTKKAWIVVIGSMVGYAVLLQIIKRFNLGSLFQLIIPNLIVGLILALPVWDVLFPEIDEYQPKSLLVPIVATIVVWGGLILLSIFYIK